MSPLRETQLIESVVAKSRSGANGPMATADVCGPVLVYAIEHLGCLVADVWSVDPGRRKLILVTSQYKSTKPSERVDVLTVDESLTGEAVETKRITQFDLDEHRTDNRRFEDTGLRQALGVDTMLSVPIFNTANPHQALCAVSLLFKNAPPPSEETNRALSAMSAILAAAIEGSLRERAYRMSMMLGQQLAAREEVEFDPFLTIPVACEILATCCLKALRATRVAIYLKDVVQDALKIGAVVVEREGEAVPQSLTDAGKERGIPTQVEKVFQTNREYLVARISDEDKPDEFVDGASGQLRDASCVLVPLQDLWGQCQGVLHCLRDTQESGSVSARFTYDDIAVLEAMSQAFIPPLETLLESEKRRFSQQKLSHELRVPVAAFQALLTRMQTECREQQFRFRYPHFKEGMIYTDLMRRLLKELDIVRFGPSNIPLMIHATNVKTEVVIPAMRFTIPLLRERHFFTSQVKYSGFDGFPNLDIDPALLTQVVFNLLDNAIKYHEGPSRDFRCEIKGQIRAQFFEIVVSDNGPGIDEAQEEILWQYGRRGENRRANAFGEGLGLWISRAIIRRHRGDLIILRFRDPTTFVLQMPKNVASTEQGYRGYVS